MASSSRPQDSSSEPSTWPGRFHSAVHGKQPHQTDLGLHPGADYVGYLDDPEDPNWFTINDRSATAEDLCTEWLSVTPNAVIDLGDAR